MNVQAILNKVIIKPEKEASKTTGGIIIPTKARENKALGIVVSIGANVKSVKVGDRVMYAKWEVTEIKIDNELHFVLEDKPEHLKALII